MQTTTDARERSIRTLLEIRDSAARDIASASISRNGSEWMRDRIKDIDSANHQLARLGYFPPHITA
jgi:hypothetical protein